MSAANVSVRVRGDVLRRERSHVSEAGDLPGWVGAGDAGDVSLWESPAALSWHALALLVAANAAERLLTERASGAVCEAA